MTYEDLKALALDVACWSNCNQAWLDTSEDEPAAVVGHISEDGDKYPVATIDCDQYYAAPASIKLARFYAAANPSAVLGLIREIDGLNVRVAELQTILRRETERGDYGWKNVGILEKARQEQDAEIARLRDDAERYRWIRHQEFSGISFAVFLDCTHFDDEAEYDRAVDEARNEEAELLKQAEAARAEGFASQQEVAVLFGREMMKSIVVPNGKETGKES